MTLSFKDYSELIIGFFFLWIGVYVLFKDPYKKISWLFFLIIVGYGFIIFTDSILLQTQTINQYILWQKITDWPLFFVPIFYYHASVLSKNKTRQQDKILITVGYLGALGLYLSDIHGGLILQESVVRFHNFRRMDGFEPGILLIPSIIYVLSFLSYGIYNFLSKINKNFSNLYYAGISGLFLVITGIIVMFSYYVSIYGVDFLFTVGVTTSLALLIFALTKHNLISEPLSFFDKAFLIKTLIIILIEGVYFLAFIIAQPTVDFPVYVLLIMISMLTIFTHASYDWLSTFVNDLVYNVSSGFSVVSDAEVLEAIKNYNNPARLEDSSLLRLFAARKNHRELPVDSLRKVLKDAIDYFQPENESKRRLKKNLKFQILKMIAFHQAEEGQILWELGFEEYPVAIMNRESRERKPLFQAISPSDYSYISRNAFIALKKEAIHDVAWRLSYQEKISRK